MESSAAANSLTKRRKVERLESAGGVVARPLVDGFEIVLCGRRQPRLWALPKGTPERGESREETALREVSEETGLQVRTNGPIDSVVYWFTRPSDGVLCHKTVHFYLMEAIGGDTAGHDREFDEVQWFEAEEALRAMTYENEAGIVQKSLSMASEARGAPGTG